MLGKCRARVFGTKKPEFQTAVEDEFMC